MADKPPTDAERRWLARDLVVACAASGAGHVTFKFESFSPAIGEEPADWVVTVERLNGRGD